MYLVDVIAFFSCGQGLYSQIRTLLQRRSLQRSFSPSLRFRFCPSESNLGTSSSANWWLVVGEAPSQLTFEILHNFAKSEIRRISAEVLIYQFLKTAEGSF